MPAVWWRIGRRAVHPAGGTHEGDRREGGGPRLLRAYEGDSDDEIGALGSSINEMSRKLEATIGELREANVRLQEDIQREREAYDELRKEFIANVSHELKTPIALIQGYAEGLKLNINEDEENRAFYCDVIMDETARMNRLVGQLLKLSQIELGYVEPLKSSFDMVGLINRVVKKNSLHLDEYRIELSVEESHLDVVAYRHDGTGAGQLHHQRHQQHRRPAYHPYLSGKAGPQGSGIGVQHRRAHTR